jgi:enamine deaminase RidA (YjgF/YER057c/UK114 family)
MTTQVIALPQQNVTNQSDCSGPRAAAVARGTNRMVKVSQYLVRPDDIPRYGLIRSKWLGDHRPASMLAVIPGLVRPDFRIKIEAYAAAPNDAKGAKD